MLFPSSPVHESNYGVPRQQTLFVLLHGTGLSPEATAEDELKSFANPSPKGMGKSYSYYITKDGTIWQLAPPDRVAFHAGTSSWSKAAAERRGVAWPAEEGDTQYAALNLTSVGIGLESHNLPDEVYPEAQLNACAALCRDLMQRYSIPAYRVLTHYMVSAPRKVDPVNFSLEEFSRKIENVKAPLLVVDAPEPVVHEGDFGSDILLRIRGKELKVDARFDPPSGENMAASNGQPPQPLSRQGIVTNDPPPPAVKVLSLQGETPMTIPAREAIALSSKAARAVEGTPDYKVSEKEAVTKYVAIIGPLVSIILSVMAGFGLVSLTDLQMEQLMAAITAAILSISTIVTLITAALARAKVYSEATVGQMLADQKELLSS